MARKLFETPGNSRPFAANYRSTCGACDDTIHPGDQVCYQDNEVIHAECREPVNLDITRKPSTTPKSVCPACSMVHVGECL